MRREYDAWLVALSVLVAVVAGYVALALAGRVTVARGGVRRAWLGAGALAMGTGIWSMHFIGMLAFRLEPTSGRPLPMTYAVPELVLSVLVAVLASALALDVAGRERLPGGGHAAASVAMGIAIAGMHYIGMAGLRVAGRLRYDPTLVAASVAIAVVASFAALWLAFRLRAAEGAAGRRLRVPAAMLIGVAIAGMHYTAMTAARFSGAEPLRATMVVHEGAVLATHGLGWAVTGTTALVLGLALSGTALDRVLRERMAHTLEVQRLYAAADAARAEAERANRAKGDFLATMSHELRTPLNAIAGHVQLLAMGIHGPVNDAQREALGRVDRAQRHLLGLINDVLNFARVESGRLEYDVREILVEDVLHDVRPMIEPQAAAKDLALDVRLPEAAGLPPVPVCADRDKLSQILLNLLSNAVKFTPPNGRIVVELAIAPADARMAELRVSDNGVGISADQLERVFEPFVQVHRTRSSESQQGTGLGLAISRDLARGMGGDLTAESEPGRGSTFVLTLRRPPGAASTAHTP